MIRRTSNWRHVGHTRSELHPPKALVVRSPEGNRLTGLQHMTPAERAAAVRGLVRILRHP